MHSAAVSTPSLAWAEFPAIPQLAGDETERKKWRRMNAVVCKACAPSPKGRYANAREMRVALQSLSTGILPPAPFSTKVFRVALFSGLLAAAIVGLIAAKKFMANQPGIEAPPPETIARQRLSVSESWCGRSSRRRPGLRGCRL